MVSAAMRDGSVREGERPREPKLLGKYDRITARGDARPPGFGFESRAGIGCLWCFMCEFGLPGTGGHRGLVLAHQDALQFFQRLAFGLGDEEENENQRRDRHEAITQERARRAKMR